MNIQAAVKGSDQTAQAGLSHSDRTYHIVRISHVTAGSAVVQWKRP